MADAGLFGLYLEQQLTIYDPELIKTRYQQAWICEGKHHICKADLPIGAVKLSATQLTEYGEAGVYDGKTSDIPMADFGAEMASFGAVMFVMGIKFNKFEIEQAKLAANLKMIVVEDPITTRISALKRLLALREHRYVLSGGIAVSGTGAITPNNARGFRGWFNNSTVPSQEIVTIPQTEKPFTMAGKALYDWFSKLLVAFCVKSGLSPSSVVAYVDPWMNRALNQFMENGSSETIASQLTSKQTSDGVCQEIRTIYELTPDVLVNMGIEANTSTGRIIFGAYRDGDVANRRYFPFQRTEPEKIPGTFDYVVLGYQGTTELMHRIPMQSQIVKYSTALT